MTNRRPRRAAPAPADPPTLDALALDPENRRMHPPRNVDLIASALRDVGAARSIVIDEHGRILAGNGVATAARAIGLSKLRIIETAGDEIIAVRRRDLTDEQKRALAIYDNRTSELAEWNLEQLALDKAAGLTFRPFWTDDEEAAILSKGLKEGRTDPDDVPAVRATDIQVGDLFALGGHRLLCGDSGDAAHVAQAFGGVRGDAVLTSPPYNVGVKYKEHDDSTQSRDAYFTWLHDVVGLWSRALHPRRAFIWNVGVSPKTAPHEHVRMLEAAGLTFVRQFVWQKVGVPLPTFHMTRADPRVRRLTANYTHEMVYVMTTGRELEQGGSLALRNETLEHDVFTVQQTMSTVDLPLSAGSRSGAPRTGKNDLDRRSRKVHPAPFPVAFPIAFLQHYVGPGEVVGEPFSGSGSTIIACEQLGAVCVALELTPQYVQVAIDRWEAFTGQQARKLGDVAGARRKAPHARPKTQAHRATRPRR